MGGGREGFFDNLHENDEEEWDRKNAAHFASYGVDLMRNAVLDARRPPGRGPGPEQVGHRGPRREDGHRAN